MELELNLAVKTPFRAQPAITQVGYALIAAGIFLFGVIMPIHLLVFVLIDPNSQQGASIWHRLLPTPILGACLAFGAMMARDLIRAGYEIARPERILRIVSAVSLAVQIVAGLLDYGLTLFLGEGIGLLVCLVAGFLLAQVGDEIAKIVAGNSAGGGLGALAGVALGYLYTDSTLRMAGCMAVGGLLAEGLGRLIRLVIRHKSKAAPPTSSEQTEHEHAGCSEYTKRK